MAETGKRGNIVGKVRYSIVIEWDPIEEVYIATVPALSIGTYGHSRSEAMAMVKEAIQVTVRRLASHRATGTHRRRGFHSGFGNGGIN